MAEIEKDLLNRKNPTQREFKAKPFLPKRPIEDLGTDKIEGKRFYSKEFMAQEWEHIWKKTWQIVCRSGDLDSIGSFYVYELGKESFLIVKGNDGVIRCFYNVCQHRGNKLCIANEGAMNTFTCPYHGWKWNNDGSLKSVANPQFFRQFDEGVPFDELALSQVKIDVWGGWLWINLDSESIALKEYLGEYGEHLESYQFENWDLIDYQSFEWNGNWKHAVDAFNESYHFASLHPDMPHISEGHDVPIELNGIHSRMLNYNDTVSEVVEGDREAFTPLRQKMMSLHDAYKGSAKDLHLSNIEIKRAQEDDQPIYKNMNDEQLVHQYHYYFFPNATFTNRPENGLVFRFRPHAIDPNKSYYDFFILVNNPFGSEKPIRPEHKIHKGDGPEVYERAFNGTFNDVFSNVLSEDGSNMETMQWGTKSDSFKGMNLCEQEIRIRHFHQTIDRFIAQK